MNQQSLFDYNPKIAVARRGNPDASVEAAAEMNASGAAAGQCQRIAEALEEIAGNSRMPHKTPGEIAKFINERDGGTFYDSVKVSKRMSNLRSSGVAASFGERTCEVQARKCGVWVWVAGCSGNPVNHASAPIGDSGFFTVQCVECGRGIGTRRAVN